MANKKPKQQLNPGAMILAIIMIFTGAVIAYLGIVNFEIYGALWATLAIISGLTSVCFSITAIVTGKQEWILLDLILPR